MTRNVRRSVGGSSSWPGCTASQFALRGGPRSCQEGHGGQSRAPLLVLFGGGLANEYQNLEVAI